MQKIEQVITTTEIAEMMDTSHRSIMRKLEGRDDRGKHIKGVIEVLTEAQMGVSDFFTPSTYQDASGKENKCYKCTRMGCEFLANKFTGKKGIIFTAKYVERFHEMDQTIKENAIEPVFNDTKNVLKCDKYPEVSAEEVVAWKLNNLHKRVIALEKEQVYNSQNVKTHMLIPKKDTWYEKNRNLIWQIHYDKDIEIKELYHIILDECNKYYNLEEAKKIYQIETGQSLVYGIGLVEYFPQLQAIADQVLDCYKL